MLRWLRFQVSKSYMLHWLSLLPISYLATYITRDKKLLWRLFDSEFQPQALLKETERICQ